MKKKLVAIVVFLVAALLSLSGCETVTEAKIVPSKPWNMPTILEESTFKIEKYLMKKSESTIKDTLLLSGEMTYRLEAESKSRLKLTMSSVVAFSDIDANGIDRGKTDKARSVVTFDAVSLTPVLSEKTVELDKRYTASGALAENNSYSLSVSYPEDKAKITWTEKAKTEEKTLGLSGQVFDNEQLFTALRAFDSLAQSNTQSFYLCVGVDVFAYGISRYTMMAAVAENLDEITLENWKGKSDYGFTQSDNGGLKVPCLMLTLRINGEKPGPAIEASYSATPFKVASNISAEKVLVGITTTEYSGGDYDTIKKTFYTLTDYHTAE